MAQRAMTGVSSRTDCLYCSVICTVSRLVNSSAVNVTLPAFAAERRAAAPLLPGAQQQTCRIPQRLSNDKTQWRN